MELGYELMDDWYKITIDDIQKHGGLGLLTHYNNSPAKALQSVYPDHNWATWKFGHLLTKHLCWNLDNQKNFLEWLGVQLEHKSMEDWYKVTKEDVYKYGGKSLLNIHHNGCITTALNSIYPQHRWEWQKATAINS